MNDVILFIYQLMLFGSSINAIQRYFWDFTAAASQYGEFSSDIVLDGDFEVEFSMSTTPPGSIQVVMGLDGSNFISVLGDSSLGVFIGGSQVLTIPVGEVTDGKLQKITLTRTGSNISIYRNGVVRDSVVNTGSVIFRYIARNSIGFYYDGIVSDLKIWKDGDRNTGTLIADFPLDSDLSNPVIANKAAVLGSELWSSTPTLGGSWIDEGAGVYSCPSVGSVSNLTGSTSLTNGTPYYVEVNVTSLTGSGASVVNGPRLTLGKNIFIIYPTIGSAIITCINTAITIADITFREAPSTTPYLTMQNMTTDDAEPLRKLDTSFSPNRWVDVNNPLDFIEVAGT